MINVCHEEVTNAVEAAGIAMLEQLSADPLLKRQFELEEGMKLEGADRYSRAVEAAEKVGREGDLVPQKDLIRENVALVANGIREWLDAEQARLDALAAAKSKSRKPKASFKWLREIGPTHAAFIGLKAMFNMVGRNRGTAVYAIAIGRAIQEEIAVAAFTDEMPKLYEKIVEDFSSRSTVHHRRVLRAAIQRHAPHLLDFDGEKAEQQMQVAVGLVVLESIVKCTGLFVTDMQTTATKTTETIELSPKALEYIEKRHDVAKFFQPFYKPTIIPPRAWTDVRSGGYHGVLAGRHCVVKGRHGDRAYIRKLRNADMSLVYEGLNYLQNTQWKVNREIFDIMDVYVFQSTLGGLPDVSKIEPLQRLPFMGEGKEKTDAKTWSDKQKELFKDWCRSNAAIHTENYEKEGQVSSLTSTIETARQYYNEERFYFPWNLDTRGRAYPIARGLQPQGTDYQKALLSFARGREYTAEARFYLMFHGANCYGETEQGVKLDKAQYLTRVKWVEDNKAFIFRIADDPHGTAHQWEGTESPWMFLAFCLEFARCERLSKAGLPAFTHLAPAFDGSCNGLQHFSAALRDAIGGEAVNLTANVNPSDIYTLVSKKLQAQLEAIANGVPVGVIEEEYEDEDGAKRIKRKYCDVTMARRWLDGRTADRKSLIGRNLCKQPVMTTPYGSNHAGIKMQMIKALEKMNGFTFPYPAWYDEDRRKKPYDNFNECTWLASEIIKAISAVVVKAREAMDWLQDAARLANKANEKLGCEIHWTAPSGLPIKQYYEDFGTMRVKTEFMGQMYVPKITDMAGPRKLSKHEQVNGIAPNFVHSLDASAMLLTVVRLGRQGVQDFFMIHDSFGVPAADAQRLWLETRSVFVEMYTKHDVLQEFRDGLAEQLGDELAEQLKPLPKKGTLNLTEVLHSDFFFA
ncbi:DNA-directed RNA polymerase